MRELDCLLEKVLKNMVVCENAKKGIKNKQYENFLVSYSCLLITSYSFSTFDKQLTRTRNSYKTSIKFKESK